MRYPPPRRGPSDHGGDGGYDHCCRNCSISFRELRRNDIYPVGEAHNSEGGICEECHEDINKNTPPDKEDNEPTPVSAS